MQRRSRTIIIDGDIIAHQSASAGVTRIDWGDGSEPVTKVDHDLVEHNLRTRMETIKGACGYTAIHDTILITFSCDSRRYWKHKLYAEYKAGRPSKPSPVKYAQMVLENMVPTGAVYRWMHCEADDIMGVLATRIDDELNGQSIIVTTDKDLNQIPGVHLNPDKIDQGLYTVTPEESLYFHMYQTLVGDATDNYPGLPGVGEVKARRILQVSRSDNLAEYRKALWKAVLKAYRDRGHERREALVQARLSYIPRNSDWNGSRMLLWKP